ncbi:TetR/AcrR family transcriptional regulator [Streptomyces sp. AM 2-1-1]|uniref:TetR/AcrR family transcriptional regulator n=1 Tax=unclassified Streptomyces TaxID=2593676 RepID=UPI0023B985DC|nr:TetR/AcrR family transcriptional regulator [Streptomyces sp. AM 2-1-1]WEH41480.1 helix-turn-helix domain containing protein [Streptomyces sp. AM 2-1-1]
MPSEHPSAGENSRDRIIAAALTLLNEQGREAVSTRAVATAAGVQAPAIYRLFGDKQGLLDAVAAHGFAAHLPAKSAMEPTEDPVDHLRAGWDLNVSFALGNPALYSLIYGEPRPGVHVEAAGIAAGILADAIRRIAAAGRLRVEEALAVQLVHAGGRGVALELLSRPDEERHPSLSAAAREAVIAAITHDAALPPGDPGPVTAAVALRAVLSRATALTDGERALLREWLDRITRTENDRSTS